MFRIENLTVHIDGKGLLNDLSFEIKAPAFVAVIGHNGSGKTSFLKSILNLLPHKGEIFLSSTPAYLSQKNTIHFDISASELSVMGKFATKRFFDTYTKDDYEDVHRVFVQLSIEHLFHSNMSTLSGGEQQLVWMAQLLLQNRTILLLDEPTQYLDVQNKKRLFNLMNEMVRTENKLIFCITHDILNLYSMEGQAYLLNLSAPKPSLEVMNREVLERNLRMLEC